MSELRDSDIAVNRTSAWISKAMDDPAWQKLPHRTFIGDVCLLIAMARAHIAEHPADEDERITREWFFAEFNSDFEGEIDLGLSSIGLYFDADGVPYIDNYDGGTDRLPHIKTRGQLRSLIHLLKGQ